jgi:hypothetical protein
MPQRNRDTDIWRKKWHRELTPAHKCVWAYLCDSCDSAGVWAVDWDLARFQIGAPDLDTDAAVEALGDQMEFLTGSKLLVLDLVRFQCGELSPKSPFHRSVWKLIQKHGLEGHAAFAGLLDRVREGLPKGSPTLKAKEELKLKQEKSNGKSKGKAKAAGSLIWIMEIWNGNRGRLAKCLAWTEKRYAKARKLNRSREEWERATIAAARAPFCNGKNDRQWRANIDTLLDNFKDHFQNAIEGSGIFEQNGASRDARGDYSGQEFELPE